VHTEITDTSARIAGWLFYDGECRLCCQSARRVQRILARRRFELRPLQSADAPERLGLSKGDVLRETRLLLADGRSLGGTDAVVEIARHIWWAWPLWLLSRAPGARPVLHAIYRVVAANRHCIGGVCTIPRRRAWVGWLPLVLLPVLAIAVRDTLPAWVFMWLIAFAIYAGFKWLTYRDTLVQGMVVRAGAAAAHRRDHPGFLATWEDLPVGKSVRMLVAEPTDQLDPRSGFIALDRE